MKAFIRDHISFILVYLSSFIILAIFIERLDGLKNHSFYFVFLVVLLLCVYLSVRYLRRRKMYQRIEQAGLDSNDELRAIYQPGAPIEKAYSNQLHNFSLYMDELEQTHEEKIQEQEFLLSETVHQMKIPLSVIQLLAQNNQEGPASKDWLQVKAESDKINHALNQLLEYSRSSQLINDITIEGFSLKGLCVQVVNELKSYFIEHEVFPKINLSDGVILYSDRKWFKVVLYQVLNNAIKYADQGSSVEISFSDGVLSVFNQGQAIPPSDINRIFNLFYTGRKGRDSSASTGIGLYLVDRILGHLKHPIRVRSNENGTSFSIDISDSFQMNSKSD